MYYKCTLIFFAKLIKKNDMCKGRSTEVASDYFGGETIRKCHHENECKDLMSKLTGRQVVVEYDSGCDFVDKFFITTSHATKTPIDHRSVSESRREALIVTLHRHIGHLSTKMLQEGLNISRAFRRRAIHLLRETHDDLIYRFLTTVVFKK